LLSLRDSTLFDVLIFTYIYEHVVNELNTNYRVIIGIPPKFEFIKRYVNNSENIYVMRIIDNINCYEQKFDIVCDIVTKNIKKDCCNYINRVCETIFGIDPINFRYPPRINYPLFNQFSDIVGINIESKNPNKINNILDINNLSTTLLDMNYELDYLSLLYLHNKNSIVNTKSNKIPKPLQTSITFESYSDIDIVHLKNILMKISQCRYFIGVDGELSLLAASIIGSGSVIVVSNHKSLLKSTFPGLNVLYYDDTMLCTKIKEILVEYNNSRFYDIFKS
jgi:hypothetical protein